MGTEETWLGELPGERKASGLVQVASDSQGKEGLGLGPRWGHRASQALGSWGARPRPEAVVRGRA